MMRFACPVCRAVLTIPEAAAGKKGLCPKCGQRLQIPAPRRATVLGEYLPEPAASLTPASPSPQEPLPRPRWWRGIRLATCLVLLLILGCPALGLIAVGMIAIHHLNDRQEAKDANQQGETVNHVPKKDQRPGAGAKQSKGEPVDVVLTEDQRIAWLKFRQAKVPSHLDEATEQPRQEVPVRIVACLPASQSRHAFDESPTLEERRTPLADDCWPFVNAHMPWKTVEPLDAQRWRLLREGRLFSTSFASGRDMGTAYFSPAFSGKFEDSALFRAELEREEKLDKRNDVLWQQPAQRDAAHQQSRRAFREVMEDLQAHFEAARFLRTGQVAATVTTEVNVKAVAVVDLFSDATPRILHWYWNDGKETKSSDHPPNQQRHKSLERFLRSLMRHAGDL